MRFGRKAKKEDELLKKLDEAIKAMDPSVIAKAKAYDEMKARASDIRLKVRKANPVMDENGNVSVSIRYEAIGTIAFDEDLKAIATSNVRAINLLDLISTDDMRRIATECDKAKAMIAENFK